MEAAAAQRELASRWKGSSMFRIFYCRECSQLHIVILLVTQEEADDVYAACAGVCIPGFLHHFFFGRPYVAKLAGSALLDMMGSHKVHNINMGDTRIHEICADVLESII